MGSLVPREEDMTRVFFQLMQHRWDPTEEGMLLTNMPGARSVYFGTDQFQANAVWHATPRSPCCVETVMICHEHIPVWYMQISGWHREEGLKILRSVLLEAYGSEVFRAGRGPALIQLQRDHGKRYRNRYDGSFSKFQGCDDVVDGNETILAEYSFRGGLMT